MGRDTLVASWQRRLDSLYPDGAIATWMRGDRDNTTYRVCWLEVTGVQGLDPILNMYVYGTPKVLDRMVLTSWEVLRAKPHFIAKATFAAAREPMMLTAAVPVEIKAALAHDRELVQAGAER